MTKYYQFTFTIQSEPITVKVVVKPIKHTYVRVADDLSLTVSTNRHTSMRAIQQLLEKNQERIFNKLQEKKRKLRPQDRWLYLGQERQVILCQSAEERYEITPEAIIFYTKKKDFCTLQAEFYRTEAEKLLSKRFMACYQVFNTKFSLPYPNLLLRKMKRRFGTCYYQKNQVVLNTELVKFPVAAIDYVIYHELTHFLVPNHSAKFYQVLALFVPNHRKLKQEMNNC